MVELITRPQPIRVPILYPRGIYSRVNGLGLVVPAGIGNEGWDYVGPLGQNMWLLQVKIVITAMTAGALINCCWRVVTSLAVPSNGGQIATQLEPVIQYRFANFPYAFYIGQDREFCFDMNKYYEGSGRRFAVWVQNNSAVVGLSVNAVFRFSEG